MAWHCSRGRRAIPAFCHSFIVVDFDFGIITGIIFSTLDSSYIITPLLSPSPRQPSSPAYLASIAAGANDNNKSNNKWQW